MEKMRIKCVRNAQGVKVKKCCASCQHKCIELDGTRVCSLTMKQVEQKFKCKQWQMSDGLTKAGLQFEKEHFYNERHGVAEAAAEWQASGGCSLSG